MNKQFIQKLIKGSDTIIPPIGLEIIILKEEKQEIVFISKLDINEVYQLCIQNVIVKIKKKHFLSGKFIGYIYICEII
jgi:hypothetical protein